MDLPSTRSKTNYWQHQQDVNHQTAKSHIKLNIDQPSTSQYSENVQFYNDNNQLKRTLSISDQRGSPFKKRQYPQQITTPIQASQQITTPIQTFQQINTPIQIQTDDDDDDNDDDDDSNTGTISSKTTHDTKRDDNQRRAAHTAAEQKRRNAIRKGYDALQSLVPNSHLLDPISSQKVSKAAILKRSTDFLAQLNKEKQQLSNELEMKKRETISLHTIQKGYEDILQMNINSSKNANASIDDEQKFKVFQNISDTLFVTFDQAMQTGQITNFSQFTSIFLRWVEDSCRPSDINEIICRVIGNSKS
ncbi:unnamed protein product [Adineta steineri]|uniref:BHLH domain-containing protein n=1 Tax=Adineta steineri TaxID=433720 RepID=A0A814W798_9BILA|nr:unnamed protein product [Adineta steineri]CAF3818988.1 unnamed protein product [Adineta steineri]